MDGPENYLWGSFRTRQGALRVLVFVFVGFEAVTALKILQVVRNPVLREPSLIGALAGAVLLGAAFGAVVLWMFLRRSVFATRLVMLVCGFFVVLLAGEAVYWNTHGRHLPLTSQVIGWLLALFAASRAHAAVSRLNRPDLRDVAPVFD